MLVTVNVWLMREMSITATLTSPISCTSHERDKIKVFFIKSSTFENIFCTYFYSSAKGDFIQTSPQGVKNGLKGVMCKKIIIFYFQVVICEMVIPTRSQRAEYSGAASL